MIRLPSYLLKHPSGIYYFRIVIPQTIRPYLKQREWKKSLRTRDPVIAKRSARLLSLQAEYLFSQVEDNYMTKKRDPVLHLTIGQFTKHPDGKIEMKGVELDPDKPEEELRLLQGLTGETGEQPALAPETPSAYLEDVIESYCEDKLIEGSWTPKTEHENRAIYELMVRIAGNLPMNGIKAEIARDYKQTLIKLPANINKSPLYRSKTIEQILAMNPTPMSVTTVNKNLTRTSSLIDWAIRHGYSEKNHFSGLNLKSKKRPDEERDHFSRNDLTNIFSHQQYINHKFRHPYYYWLPLLGLYTGARLEELCQLYLDDIYQEDDVWLLDINDRNDKKLKNKSSKRIIPIHPKLLKLGFMDYVQKLKDRDNFRLFPELTKGRDG